MPLKFWWYDGKPQDPYKPVTPTLRPTPATTKDLLDLYGKLPEEGRLLVGDKGKFFSPSDDGSKAVLMLAGENSYSAIEKHEAARGVPQTIPRSPGHNEEQCRMMRDGTPAYSNL